LTAFLCQLTASVRTAMAYAFLALGFFYILRAPGDMNPDMELLVLISPLGLPLRTEAFIFTIRGMLMRLRIEVNFPLCQ
jgi:putative exporter of polyketide antibiotics